MSMDWHSPEDSMDTTTPLIIRLETEFSCAMEALRRAGWADPLLESARDEFDADSLHLVVRLLEQPVGMVRLTQGPQSPLCVWSGGRAPLPSDPSVAELTRGVVAPAMRRLGIYRLMMLETVLRLGIRGVLVATGAIEPDFPARFFLAELGFLNVSTPILFDDHPRRGTYAQCIRLDITPQKQVRWLICWEHLVAQLLGHNYTVDSDLTCAGYAHS
jgi:hypothetical protein